MRKEIGGYFEFEKGIGNEYYDFLRFNSSRNSLQFILRSRNIKKIYIPYYLCLAIKETLENENVEICYYHINEDFLPEDFCYDGVSYVYLVNFFGLLSRNDIMKIINKYNEKIILDNTHSFFMKPFKNVDVIYNCRKYFGVPDGSYLFSDLKIDNDYRSGNSLERLVHLFGRYEFGASAFYESYLESEKSLENRDIELMSNITQNMLKNIDYDLAKKIRTSNFNYLCKKFKTINSLNFKNDATNDFMFPLLVCDGSKVKKYLIQNKIYVPNLWPNLEDFPLNSFEINILSNLILIPIDQRYCQEDMDFVYDKIMDVIGE